MLAESEITFLNSLLSEMNREHVFLAACSFLYYKDHTIQELQEKVERMLSTLSMRECYDSVEEIVKDWKEVFVMDHQFWKVQVKKERCFVTKVDELLPKQKEALFVTPLLLEYAERIQSNTQVSKEPPKRHNDPYNLMLLHQCIAVLLRKEPQYTKVSHQLGPSVRKMHQEYCEQTGTKIPFPNSLYKVEPAAPFRFLDQRCFQMKFIRSQEHVLISLLSVEPSEACVDIPESVERLAEVVKIPETKQVKIADTSLADIELAKQLVAVILFNCKDYRATVSTVGGRLRLLLDQWNLAITAQHKLPPRILSFLPEEFYVTINETNHMIQKISHKDEWMYALFITDNTSEAVMLDPTLFPYIPNNRFFRKEQAKGFPSSSATDAPNIGTMSNSNGNGKDLKAEMRDKLKNTLELLNSQLDELPEEQISKSKKKSRKDKKKEKDMSLSEVELEYLVPMVCLCLLQRPDRRLSSSFLGSDIRELNAQWCNSTGRQRAIPPRVFAGLPEECQVQLNEDLFLMTKVAMSNEFEFSLEDAEERTESLRLYSVKSDLLDILDSESSADGDNERLERILESEPIRVDSLPIETLGTKLLQYYNQIIRPNLLSPNSRIALAKGLEKLLTTEEHPVKILLFGSSVNNLGLIGSDVDITIVPLVPNSESMPKDEAATKYVSLLHEHPYKNMKTLAKKLRKARMGQVIPIGHARVPICKFVHPLYKVACDINFGHALGYHNSKLLHAYTKMDPRVKPLIMLVKFWAKQRDLNDPAGKHTISSYAWSIMVIAFLIHKGYIKSLQDPDLALETQLIRVPEVNTKGNSTVDRVIDVTACYDLHDLILEPILKRKFDGKEFWGGPDGIASLLEQFFDFYGHKYKYKPSVAITIRDGTAIRIIPPTDNRKLVVLDPFELDRNCTSMVQKALPLIIEEFRSAYRLFRKGNMEQLFQKTEVQVKKSKRMRNPKK
jgi:DNA polymerase sigma